MKKPVKKRKKKITFGDMLEAYYELAMKNFMKEMTKEIIWSEESIERRRKKRKTKK
jgi:hypothetical protein